MDGQSSMLTTVRHVINLQSLNLRSAIQTGRQDIKGGQLRPKQSLKAGNATWEKSRGNKHFNFSVGLFQRVQMNGSEMNRQYMVSENKVSMDLT